jgi:hypothetical protein
MSNSNATIERFQKQYVATHFERADLFKFILEEYHPREVLYPGCAIHITPAYFFPHIVFVDQDSEASKFFSNQEAILDWVNRHKKYQRSSYIQFINQDFTKPLPVRNGEFDLLLALYTGSVSKACTTYLKVGGVLLTNNHQNDAVEAAQEDELSLIAIVRMRGGKYQYLDAKPGQYLRRKSQESRPKRYLKRISNGVKYVENESYYIFKKVRSHKE